AVERNHRGILASISVVNAHSPRRPCPQLSGYAGRALVLRLPKFFKERLLIPLDPGAASSDLPLLSLGSLSKDPGDQRLPSIPGVLTHLNSQNLRNVHLGVQELDYTSELGGYLVGDEQQPDAAGLQVGPDPHPELVRG